MFIFLKETRAKPHIGARKMDKKCKKSNDQATLVILGKQSGRGEKNIHYYSCLFPSQI